MLDNEGKRNSGRETISNLFNEFECIDGTTRTKKHDKGAKVTLNNKKLWRVITAYILTAHI